MNLLQKIRQCFNSGYVLYTRHARFEMKNEELGQITENEVYEAVINGEIVEEYPDDTPYPSVLILGRTYANRPLHAVCAYDQKDSSTIIVTVYQPNPALWIEYKRRKL